MNGRPLTEAQISQALRANLPNRAQAGLRERILVAVDTTAQQRALPSFLGVLQDADRDARRRNLLIAAALLIALAIAAAAAAGAWLSRRDVAPDLSILPPADLQALPNPSPSPSAPSAAPTPSAVTSPAGVWIATRSMGTPRSRHTAVRLLDGRVLVVGGANDDENDISAELYEPNSGTWTATGNMLKPHRGFPATLLSDGRVLVGDVDDPDPAADDDEIAGAEVYDPASGTWSATGKMVNGGDGASTATLLRDGKVLVIGHNDTGEVYDPDSGTWTATGKMTNRHSHAAILLPDGKVLVAGGHDPGDTPIDSAELYDPDTGAWTAIASMHAPRDTIELFLRPDGKVLVVGASHRGNAPTSAELYDPATGAWTVTGDTARPGIVVNTTLLADGRVLVSDVSGDEPDSPPYAELYDPVAGSWTSTAPMLRSHRTPAILLLDGTVLVAGGNDCQDGVCVATGSAELYVPQGVSPPPLPAFPSPPQPVIPSPTPSPTPYPPAVGPIPPNARPWKVTVVNDSSKPALLFAAEEDESGPVRLCAFVLPNVVPPHATMKVTFLLPPKSVKSCWIWVNPVPGDGGAGFQTSDAPLKGTFFIDAAGQTMWGGS